MSIRSKGAAWCAMLLAAGCAGAAMNSFAQAQGASSSTSKTLPTALPKGKKLVLADGTFQVVRSYEKVGDRVRFYSVERSAWEEIPAALVDWEATRRAEAVEAERLQALEEKKKEIRTTQIAEEVDVDASLEIAPGVFLPDQQGMYVLDGNVTRTVGTVEASEKLNKKRKLAQIFSPIPIIPSQHKIELKGARATMRIQSAQPEFYVRTADDHEPELELIRTQVKGDARLIEAVSTYFTGDRQRNRDAISVERWRVARGVYRITMSQSLDPGEYVLAEVLRAEEGPSGISLHVWDFGVDGPAPASAPSKK